MHGRVRPVEVEPEVVIMGDALDRQQKHRMAGCCECEHAIHFRPHAGAESHIYGKHVGEHNLTAVKTTFGTFNICKVCHNTCYKQMVQEGQA
jgi:hypothetical protein